MATTTVQIILPTVTRQRQYVAIEQKKLQQMEQRLHELEHALRVITVGEKEYHRGKTRQVKSLAELL